MAKRLFGICIVSCLCFLLFLASHKFSSLNIYKPASEYRMNVQNYPLSPDESSMKLKYLSSGTQEYSPALTSNYTHTEVVNAMRERIAMEMTGFSYPRGTYGQNAEQLTDLTMETDGTPIRSVIITTWRSGSTFVGDILNAMPGNYYHYEPLLNYEIIQIRGPPYARPAVDTIKKLLKCNYDDMEEYLEYGKDHQWLFTHNQRLWENCGGGALCWDPKFLNEFCRLFPLQSMKVVRLRLALAEDLLKDESLNVRIILLVRDPRGTLQSRRHREWCPGQKDCDHAPLVCEDMVADYHAAIHLQQLYPSRFRAIRYEDLSLEPWAYVRALLGFLGLPVVQPVLEFLESHTREDVGGVSSTFRNSKAAPFHWKQDLGFNHVRSIQDVCVDAMTLWGYNMVHDKSQLQSKSWSPLGPRPSELKPISNALFGSQHKMAANQRR